MPEYNAFQRISSELFAKTAEYLRRQLIGPVRLPSHITEQDLEKLDQIAKQAWMKGKGNYPRKMVHYGNQAVIERKVR